MKDDPRRSGNAQVLPFPLARRTAYVRRHAARMAALGHDAAERYLRAQLQIQEKTLRRRAVAELVIAEQLRSLESAIRAALWHAIMSPGDTA